MTDRIVRYDHDAVVQAGGDWVPIGHGIEARTVLSDRLGTLRLRYVGGDILTVDGVPRQVVQKDFMDRDEEWDCYTVWVERGADG
jgi:hypothetical protein